MLIGLALWSAFVVAHSVATGDWVEDGWQDGAELVVLAALYLTPLSALAAVHLALLRLVAARAKPSRLRPWAYALSPVFLAWPLAAGPAGFVEFFGVAASLAYLAMPLVYAAVVRLPGQSVRARHVGRAAAVAAALSVVQIMAAELVP